MSGFGNLDRIQTRRLHWSRVNGKKIGLIDQQIYLNNPQAEGTEIRFDVESRLLPTALDRKVDQLIHAFMHFELILATQIGHVLMPS